MNKKIIRQEIKRRREALSREYIERANKVISEKLLEHPLFLQANTIFTYVNMDREPSTETLIRKAFELGKSIAVPRCIKGTHQMEAVKIQSFSVLEEGAMGILEPKEGLELIRPEDLDLIIVPCVSANPRGLRLGHGAGYYDRFLKKTGAYKLCLCYDRLLYTDIPVDENDIAMDAVLTEKNHYLCLQTHVGN